jgi:hypothetical protein
MKKVFGTCLGLCSGGHARDALSWLDFSLALLWFGNLFNIQIFHL